MLPETIVRMVTAVAEAVIEVAKFLQTPEGQEQLKMARQDRSQWDSWWSGAWGEMKKFFRGELFK